MNSYRLINDKQKLSKLLSRTKYIHFGIKNISLSNKQKITVHSNSCLCNSNPNIICNWFILNQVTSLKYLAVLIDKNLKWDVHMNYVYK